MNDIVDFKMSMRDREVARESIYSNVRRDERERIKNFDESTNKLKSLSHVI